MRPTTSLLLGSALLLAACARSEEASLLPPDDPAYNSVEQVRNPEGDDQEVALGQWRSSLQEEVRVLEFGPVGTQPLFSLRCDERRGVMLQRHGDVPTGDLPVMLLQIGSETRRYPITSTGGALPLLRATVPPSDPMLQTLVSSTESMIIRIGDAAPLVLPHSAEVGTFVRSCSNPGSGAAPVPSEGGNMVAPAPEGNSAATAPTPSANSAAPAPTP